MAVFRIEKTRDYTVMSNHHLRNTNLSLKAKGLLSLMLSLPEGWDYTTKGLAHICKDGVDSICAGVRELEEHGYVVRERVRGANGQLGSIEYTILEQPRPPEPEREKPKQANPVQANPVLDSPVLGKPEQENPAQLNIQESITEKSITDLSSKDSFFPSAEAVPSTRQAPLTDGRTERERIREQIEYEIMRDRYSREQLDELVEIMLEVSMNRSPTIRIGRDAEYPTSYVQERFSKINAMHIERVCDGIRDNHTQVRNTKAYLLAALFNAVSTLDSYYTMQANSDFGGSF